MTPDQEWSEVTVYALAIVVTLLITLRNISLSRGTQVDTLQLATGIFLLAQFGACILDCIFYTSFNLCHPSKYARFVTFVIFQLLCNSVLITRITILIPKRYQSWTRGLLFMMFIISMILITWATIKGYEAAINKPSTEDDIERCSMTPDSHLLSVSKLIKAIMYLGLLACFRVPFNRILRQIRSSDHISVDKLQTVSNKVFLQISLPIIVYLVCAIIGFADKWGSYVWLSYAFQDLSIFVAMSFTYAMADRESKVDVTALPSFQQGPHEQL